jgi:hypothetical protein
VIISEMHDDSSPLSSVAIGDQHNPEVPLTSIDVSSIESGTTTATFIAADTYQSQFSSMVIALPYDCASRLDERPLRSRI